MSQDNPAPQGTTATPPAPQDSTAPVNSGVIPQGQSSFSWKSNLNPDYANSATMQKFSDDKNGFNDAIKSHLALEQLLGQDKVPVPKGPDDAEGWSRFSKAMGIPERSDQYGLPDVEVPESMKGLQFNKQEFAEVAHSLKMTPNQAKELWNVFTTRVKEGYSKQIEAHKKHMTEIVNQMRSEWGDAYDSNVELGQMVINKFSSDKESEEYITSSLLKDPRGIKFLAKIGGQFAENRVGDFSHKRFSLTPDQAREEWLSIVNDPKDPYNDDKANPQLRKVRIDYVNGLIKAASFR